MLFGFHAVVESFAVLTLFQNRIPSELFLEKLYYPYIILYYFGMSTAHASSSGPKFMSILDSWNVKDEVSATAMEEWGSEEAE